MLGPRRLPFPALWRSTLQACVGRRGWRIQSSGAVSVSASPEAPAVTTVITSCDKNRRSESMACIIYLYVLICTLHGFTTYSTRLQSTIEMHSKAHTAEVC